MTPTPLSAEILARHAEFVRRLARGLVRDADLAEDVAQETLVAAWQHPPRQPASLRAWMAQTARRAAGALGRSERRRHDRERSVARPEASDPALEVVSREAVLRSVTAAVLDLEEPYRTVVLLHDYEGLPHAEIAARTGALPVTVRSQLRRARIKLRERLDRELGRRETWTLALLPFARRPAASVGPAGSTAGAGIASAIVPVVAVTAVVLAVALWTERSTGPRLATAVPHALPADGDARPKVGTVAALAGDGARELVVDAVDASLQEVLVLRPGGAPAARTVLALFDASGLLAHGATDAGGRAALPAGEGAARLGVRAPGFPLSILDVDRAAGRVEVQLPAGARVAGRVVDRGRPVAGLEVWLASDFAPAGSDALPERAVTLLDAVARSATVTDESGTFAFEGLPDGWAGDLRLPDGRRWIVRASDGTRQVEAARLRLEAPLADLEIEARECRRVSGRVVRPGGGAPVAGAELTVLARYADGSSSRRLALRTGADGRFAGWFARAEHDDVFAWRLRQEQPEVERLEVRLLPHRDGGGRTLALEGAALAGAPELGDLELAPVRSAELRVVDARGRPVAGAFARAPDCAASGPSDANGRLLVEGLPPQVCALEVAAPDHAVRALTLHEALDAPVDVALDPCNRLEVRVRVPTSGLRLVVDGEGGPFAVPGAAPGSHPLHALAGASASVSADERTAAFRLTPPETRVVLHQVTRSPLSLRVVDRDRILAELPPLVLGPTEHRDVELEVREAPRELAVHIVDESGVPLRGAGACLRAGATVLAERNADAFGACRFRTYHAGRVDLAVDKPGYAARCLEDLDASDFPVQVTLVRGLSVRVRVLDPHGREVPARSVSAPAEFPYRKATPEADGSWHLVDQPPRRVLLRARVGGASYEVEHDALVPEAVIRVPEHGSLEVGLGDLARLPRSEGVRVRLVATDGSGLALVANVPTGTPGGRPVRLPAVLPGEYEVRAVSGERVLAGPVRARVEAGRTARVDL